MRAYMYRWGACTACMMNGHSRLMCVSVRCTLHAAHTHKPQQFTPAVIYNITSSRCRLSLGIKLFFSPVRSCGAWMNRRIFFFFNCFGFANSCQPQAISHCIVCRYMCSPYTFSFVESSGAYEENRTTTTATTTKTSSSSSSYITRSSTDKGRRAAEGNTYTQRDFIYFPLRCVLKHSFQID